MDRRIRKNQAAIMDALVRLMAKKDFDKITIHEIADTADVNRGTIYAHFTDKYDLLDKCVKTRLQQLIESCRPVDGTFADSDPLVLLRTVELMERDAPFYRTLLTNKNIPSFRIHLQDLMKQEMRGQFASDRPIPDGTIDEIQLQFLSSAIAGVIEWWFTHPAPCSAKALSERLSALANLHRRGIL